MGKIIIALLVFITVSATAQPVYYQPVGIPRAVNRFSGALIIDSMMQLRPSDTSSIFYPKVPGMVRFNASNNTPYWFDGTAWKSFGAATGAVGSGTVTSVAATNSLGITWGITNPTTSPNISLALTSTAVGLQNVPNVNALLRENHIGSQSISTVNGLQDSLSGKQQNITASTPTFYYAGDKTYKQIQYSNIGNAPAPFNPIQGTGIVLSGSYPNITFSAPGGGSGGSAAWGSITGTISDQIDLQNALNAREIQTNKANNLVSPDNIKYPTTLAVSNALSTVSSSIPSQFNPIQGSNMTLSGSYPNITFSSVLLDTTTIYLVLNNKLNKNSAITPDTKTKITYDTNGLVLSGADATTSDIAEGSRLYFTDARVSANSTVAANTAARHAAVTLGTANGLSLASQVLSLQLASNSQTGALSSSSFNTFNNKQDAIGYTAENIANKVTDLTSPDNTKYPSSLAVSNELALKQPLISILPIINGGTGTNAFSAGSVLTGGSTSIGSSANFVYLNNTLSIGSSSGSASALLDMQSTSRGALLPRMTIAQRNAIGSPAAGLMLMNLDSNYVPNYYNGTRWVSLASTWNMLASNQYSAINGNVGIGIYNPTTKLQVNGTIQASDSAAGNNVKISPISIESTGNGGQFAINAPTAVNISSSFITLNGSILTTLTGGGTGDATISSSGVIGRSIRAYTSNGINANTPFISTAPNTYTTSATPTVVLGSGAGTGASYSISGTNKGGVLTVTTGTSPTASNSIAMVNFSSSFSYPNGISIILFAREGNSAALSGASNISASPLGTTNSFSVVSGSVSLTALTTYTWNYIVEGF